MSKIDYSKYTTEKNKLIYFYRNMFEDIMLAANAPRAEDLMLELIQKTIGCCINALGEPPENIERKLDFMDEVQDILTKMRKYRAEDFK